MQRSVRITGICCCVLAMLALIPALLMKCILPAMGIGGVSLLAGLTLGLGMAAITRCRRPTIIYLLVISCAATAWPLYHEWPSAFAWNILEQDGTFRHLLTYLEALRPTMYLLGVPFPYAWLGQHASDPIPAGNSPETETTNTETGM